MSVAAGTTVQATAGTAPLTGSGWLSRGLRAFVAPALVIVGVLAVWEILPPALDMEPYILPTPSDIAVQLRDDRALLWDNLQVTLTEVLLGFLLAFAVGMVLGFVVAHSQIANRAIYPLLVASQTVPVIAIAPVFIIWFGYGILPKVIITALICFFPLTVNTVSGYASVDADAKMLFKAYGTGPLRTFRLLSLPAALPSIFAGIKISITLSVIGATIGEYVGSQEGLGFVIVQASGQILTTRVFAAITVLSFMGIALFLIATLVERLVMPWRHQTLR